MPAITLTAITTIVQLTSMHKTDIQNTKCNKCHTQNTSPWLL